MSKKGNLSIDSENIFPIIKKWLYSDHDIFLRELISNACDAITKLKKLSLVGEAELANDYQPRVDVLTSSNNKTLKVSDNGLGMTEEEVDKYINQIAFSGAADFMTKYKDKADQDQIIGHFGLGFYSTFMVADKVEIDTLSHEPGAKPVHWESKNGVDFEMTEGTRTEVGTTVTLHMADDSHEFSNEYRIRGVLEKYCGFMPYEIFLTNEDTKAEKERKAAEEAAKKAAEGAENEADKKEEPKEKPVNDTEPLWTKHPNECKDEDYKEFFRKVFKDYRDPLFWIHLNMDYPFNLKGILYFPKLNYGYESLEGTIKLYNNQVFVADNIKEVIPEYMMLLKGVIDCPDLPLNVSRSALQNDGFVKKIQDYISKKLADKLSGLCKVDREFYEKNWDSISPFVKYGCLRDEKFCKKMTDYILFKNLDGKYEVLPECLEVKPVDDEPEEGEEKTEGEKKTDVVNSETGEELKDTERETPEEKKEKTIVYVTDPVQQSQYVNMFKKAKMDAVLLTDQIDVPFIQQLEMKNEGIHFKRIDAHMEDSLKAKNTKKLEEELKVNEAALGALFKKILKKDNVKIKAEKLKNKDISSMLTVSEEALRMREMMRQYGMKEDEMGSAGNLDETLILNVNNKLVQYLLSHTEGENVTMVCEELYDLARIQQAPLKPDAMTKFVARTNQILGLLAQEN